MDELIAEKYERAAASTYKLVKALATQQGVKELNGPYEWVLCSSVCTGSRETDRGGAIQVAEKPALCGAGDREGGARGEGVIA